MISSIGLIILGGGGHARDVASIALATAGLGGGVAGYVSPDQGDSSAWARLQIPWLGDDSVLSRLPKGAPFVVGIGSGKLRRLIDVRARHLGLEPATLIHPSAAIGPDVRLGEGAVIFPNTTITTNVSVGRHVHINVCASVSHDCRLGDFVSINPGARLCGWVAVGEETMVGAGAVINERRTVGSGAVVGSGAAVVADVPAATTVAGVPARALASRRRNTKDPNRVD